ncbi:short-chain dehydrogenase/reductase [Gluconacetobacter liquefaciens]|uniref:SDR family NAD(P)-dependent oxidoreductase n=1 Tax=Gluconacetobacter liquefaciens TaxID=89584 RepID=A0A370G822_GLULI|nr:oxidoreductase [Gluconacetobacter liquefaciens]MBB2185463.1 SDR family NAD(P)-dependent oxidoreductase [Gluconacetobacter liquefaciens]RDI39266.1 short-subunit dehydrogenase [Gluconacetobacter liquefaciens]GBQ94482.1 dehydrogenase [Gluconacetobacter liquefaciens NRIC 0522]GEB38038.1 short-chain dehydrogenase/reductase [Gluconacetobacter liquefaciens]
MNAAKRQVALVTGASSGMGKDFALRLIAEGYMVYGAARRIGRMAEIQSAGGKVIPLDVTDDASIVNCVEQIIREQGQIDVLINNAGYGQFGALEDVPLAEGRRQIETNLIGPARLTQLCIPHMRARKFGKIFNISSIGGKLATPLGGWYHASKYALEGYSDSLRNEVRRFGIDVVVIEPGGIQTEWAGIASDEAERYSSHGAYADYVAKFRREQKRLGKNPPPKVISDLIVKALRAKRPAARYHGGRLSGPLLILRSILSDRMLDKVIMSASADMITLMSGWASLLR